MTELGKMLAYSQGVAALAAHAAAAALAAAVLGVPGAFVCLIATFSLDMLRGG